MKKSKVKYQISRSSREILRQEMEQNFYVKKVLTPLELESVTAHYVKRESEPALDFLRLLLFLMSVPLLIGTMFLLLLMVGFVMLVMSAKDLVVEPIRSWLVRYFRGRKKVQVQ